MERGLGSFPNPRFHLMDGKEDNSFSFQAPFQALFLHSLSLQLLSMGKPC